MALQVVSSAASSTLVLCIGFAAGMQLGKIAPLVGRLQADLGISLTFAGWLTSLLGLFVALAAYPAARMVARIGATRSLLASALVMIGGAVALGLSQSPTTLVMSRGVEAAGYVVMVIAAPAYLVTFSPVHMRSLFLALWGSFVPVGYALANLQVALLPVSWSLEWTLLTFAAPMAALLMLAIFVSPADAVPSKQAPVTPAPIPSAGLALAIAFGLYVYLSIGFFTFLPEYISTLETGHAVSAPLVAICVPLGSFATAALLKGPSSNRPRILAIAGFVAAALAACLLYSSVNFDILAMPVYAFAGGMAASSIFALIPCVAVTEAAAASVVGAVAQCGGIATLIGPPIAGFLAETYGWHAVGWSLAGVSLIGACLILVANVLAARRG
ncbi:MFS transporter [Mesorhizobium xinjiangense]|uniref:MFS transporter n=1 Tax=Mesorhizobium xinjiangense TaxID=2678685 RepID=UPI0012ED5054|nr:MFS transporter [Mesorhizobium xinjiangense]